MEALILLFVPQTPRTPNQHTPTAMAQPTTGRSMRATSTLSIVVSTPPPEGPQIIPSHYLLAPTLPRPFGNDLEGALDGILEFGRIFPEMRAIVETLLKEPDTTTNWPLLIKEMWDSHPLGRGLMEELLFLVTRCLLPEQISHNRALLYRLYSNHRGASVRLILRYDMLREWHHQPRGTFAVVDSLSHAAFANMQPPAPISNPKHPYRRPLMPNIWATLIVGQPTDYPTRRLSDAMRHHVTDLDKCLLLRDEEVAERSDAWLLSMLPMLILQWQLLRKNTMRLEDMEVGDWEELKGRADELEWVRDPRNKEIVEERKVHKTRRR